MDRRKPSVLGFVIPFGLALGVSLAFAGGAFGQAFSFTSTGTPAAIPPSGSAGTTIVTLTAPTMGTIGDLDVFVDLNHTFTGDLDLFLEKDGIRVQLFNQHGGGGNDIQDVLFDDEAATAVNSVGAPFGPGTFRPTSAPQGGESNLLSDFDGAQLAGVWTLRIVDNFLADVGTLLVFRIQGVLVAVFVPSETPIPDFSDGAVDPIDFAVAEALQELYGTTGSGNADLDEVLDAVADTSGADRSRALKALAPDEVPAQVDIALRAIRSHLEDLRDRARALREGGVDTATTASWVPGVGSEPGHWQVNGPRALATTAADAAAATLDPGAVAASGADPVAPATDVAAAGLVDEPGRIGVWAQGRGIFGDKDATSSETGYDLDARGASVGLDLRVTEQWVVGVAGGIVGSDLDYDDRLGSLDAESWFASFYSHLEPVADLYVDFSAAYGWDDYETRRAIAIGPVFRRAKGDTDGDTWALDLQAFYDLGRESLHVGPLLGVRYIDTSVDSYRENGAGTVSLRIPSQDANSFQSRLGAEANYAIETPFGSVTPHLRGEWIHEYEDDGRGLTSAFRSFPGTPFRLRTDSPDRDWFEIGAGVSATLGEHLRAFVRYETALGLDDWNLHQVTGGLSLVF